MNTFICYPKCTTCQKAKKWLDDNNIAYEMRDIKEASPSYEELEKILKLSEEPIKRLFNTSGMLYKSLQLKDRLPTMTESEMLTLLSTDGMLVKRPILLGSDFALIGFKEEKWAEKVK